MQLIHSATHPAALLTTSKPTEQPEPGDTHDAKADLLNALADEADSETAMIPNTGQRRDLGRRSQGKHRSSTLLALVARSHYVFQAMQPLKAHVHNGRLVLDEPTDLPEGEVIELLPVDEVLAAGGDYLDEEERERLHDSIERGLEDVKAGRTIEASTVIKRLRAPVANR